jgi:RNA polymerase sigma factor (sigma-70 family)
MRWQDADVGLLVRRCRAGDPRAWDSIVDRYAGLVFSVARRAGLGPDDAEDCSQGVFLKLYQNLDRIDNLEALPGWLSVTTAREAYRIRRVSSKYVTIEDGERTLDETIASEESAADDLAELSQSVFAVREAMQGLREKCRDLLAALYMEEEPSYQEISSRLKIPVGSIGPTRARCIESLRALLAKTGFFRRDPVSAEEDRRSVGSRP